MQVDHCKLQNIQKLPKNIMKSLELHHLGSFVQLEFPVYMSEFLRTLIGLKVLCGIKTLNFK